ncbi:dipeptidase [Aurantimonas sp. VKM B-3413]|uniref:dipeptidase n=1 Tax=Aurantimonas sp. VKM B-3413 TaxID=2779401 RepID=UPI001E52C77D|nr:dipeptidase [Aurantimonas sp. VKM B-3413]MCB8838333.1 dipeptidase [Aurantimonas sp. VKM B-3413]
MPAPLVFDGHNDSLLRLYVDGSQQAIDAFLAGTAPGHIDLAKAKAGNLGGGLFAIFPPSPRDASILDRMPKGGYQLPLPVPLETAVAEAATIGMVAILFRLERGSGGRFRVCRSVADIRAAWDAGAMAAVMHIEGAEAIDSDLKMLDVLHAAGLRSIGMVWSRNNIFAHGVPMRFPSSPDVGDGLTEAGVRLVRRSNELGILLDLSHLNEKGFWDVARLSDAPLVATHSNVHAICPVSRNLTDKQLAAIAESKGVVGLNFATAFLREDGSMDADTPIETMARHLDGLLERLGEDGVALGSDFDGAVIPAAIGDAAGLPALFDALEKRGYGRALVEKIAHGNWLGVLERTWKTPTSAA